MSSHEQVSKYVPFRFQAMPPPSVDGAEGFSACERAVVKQHGEVEARE
jgi:hypothetical protein